MTTQPRLALTFEDVLLVPRRSSVRSRRHVATRSRFSRGLELAIPIVSANMDTVTTAPMAIAMAELGGLGVIHRFLPVDGQAEEVRRGQRYPALVVAVAHGHADPPIEAVRELKATWPSCDVVAGNAATADGFGDLAEAGADAVKVGIGPGLACTTRLVAGVGVPQLTAILDCAEVAHASGVPLIADGGIRHPGDVAKAIAAGASTVMIGGLFAGRAESPGEVVRRGGRPYKVFRGMASYGAAAARLEIEGRGDALDQYVPEGEELEFPLRGPVAEVVNELVGGLRSGMSYIDATTVQECWDKAVFVRQTPAGRREARPGSSEA